MVDAALTDFECDSIRRIATGRAGQEDASYWHACTSELKGKLAAARAEGAKDALREAATTLEQAHYSEIAGGIPEWLRARGQQEDADG